MAPRRNIDLGLSREQAALAIRETILALKGKA
jgi:hypothetical protein